MINLAKGRSKSTAHFLKTLTITVVFIWFLMNYVLINAYVPTGSMKHTIMPGNRLIGIRLIHEYKRGDIVIFKQRENNGAFLVKRVIGVSGDRIEIKKGGGEGAAVYVNGEIVSEPYLPEEMFYEEGLFIRVPENGYFVMGDNRNHSFDARYWENKIIYSKDIVGIVKLRYWPLKDAVLF